jgi:hypothetical protein
MTIAEINALSQTRELVRHHGSGLFFIRSRNTGTVLNSAMSLEWAKRSMLDSIDSENRIKGA